jgi:hypothetical protein
VRTTINWHTTSSLVKNIYTPFCPYLHRSHAIFQENLHTFGRFILHTRRLVDALS